jgi:ankyrin repeat protein
MSKRDDPRLTQLMKAAVWDHDLARKLVKEDPSILKLRNSLGETALHYLAVEDYGAAVQLLIDLGASVNVTNDFGATPYQETQYSHAKKAREVLRRAGAK